MKITHGLDVSSINTHASEMIIQKNLSIGARVDEAEVEIFRCRKIHTVAIFEHVNIEHFEKVPDPLMTS